MELTKEKKLEVIDNIRSYFTSAIDEALATSFGFTAEECGNTEEEVEMIKDYLENFNFSGYLIIEDNDEEYKIRKTLSFDGDFSCRFYNY